MTASAPSPDVTQQSPGPTKNGLATAGFVLGLLGLIFSFIPVIGVIAWPLVILGFIFAVIGFMRVRKGAPNKGLSIAGIVCSVIGLVVCIFQAAVFTAVVNEAANSGSPNAVNQDAGQPGAGIGEPVSDGMFEFTVTEVEDGMQHVGDGITRMDAQGQWVIVHVTVRNTGDESRNLSMSVQKLHDTQGRAFEASSGEALMALPNSEAFVNNINPGNSAEAQLLFDVPEDVQLSSIELHDSLMSNGVTVSLQDG